MWQRCRWLPGLGREGHGDGIDTNGFAKSAWGVNPPCKVDGKIYYGSRPAPWNDGSLPYGIRANHRKDRSNILFYDLHVASSDPGRMCGNGGVCTGWGNGTPSPLPHVYYRPLLGSPQFP